jgi:hypothetical protein
VIKKGSKGGPKAGPSARYSLYTWGKYGTLRHCLELPEREVKIAQNDPFQRVQLRPLPGPFRRSGSEEYIGVTSHLTRVTQRGPLLAQKVIKKEVQKEVQKGTQKGPKAGPSARYSLYT